MSALTAMAQPPDLQFSPWQCFSPVFQTYVPLDMHRQNDRGLPTCSNFNQHHELSTASHLLAAQESVAEGQLAADCLLKITSSSLHTPGSSLLLDRLAGEGDTMTRSTGARTCPWHLPKRISQSHSAAALEESPPCTLPGSVGLQTKRTVFG